MKLNIFDAKIWSNVVEKSVLTFQRISAIIIKSSRGRHGRVRLLAQHGKCSNLRDDGKSYHKKLFEKVLTKGLKSDIILKLS